MKIEWSEQKIVLKVLLVLSFCFFLYLFCNIFYLKQSSTESARKFLKQNLSAIVSDLKYIDGQWDTSVYVSDESIAADIPLYIFSINGYLIDRRNPIPGYLNTADFNYALSFRQPKTFTSPINEEWRVYSRPVIRDENIVGAILVAYYYPTSSSNELDSKLIETAKLIDSKLKITNGALDGSTLKSKDIPYDIYFEVIDRYNKVLFSVGGPPSMIDSRNIQDALNNYEQIFTNPKLGERFLLYSQPIRDRDQQIIGLVSVGRSLKSFDDIIYLQTRFSLISAGVILILLLVVSYIVLRQEIETLVAYKLKLVIEPEPREIHSIKFNVEESTILIDGDTKITVPEGSLQFSLCKSLFLSPKKFCFNDELLDELGLSDDQWHSIYDARRELNKRVKKIIGIDLVLYKSGKYSINPILLQKLS